MYIETSSQPRCALGFRGHSCNWATHVAGLFEKPYSIATLLKTIRRMLDEAPRR